MSNRSSNYRKPRKKKNRLFIIYLSALLIIIAASAVYMAVTVFLPNFKLVDFYTYYPELNKDEIYIVLGQERLDARIHPVVEEKDDIYLPVDFVKNYLDKYIFWDSESDKLTITTSESVIRMKTEELNYTVNNQPMRLNLPVYNLGGVAYLPSSLLSELYEVDISYDVGYNMVIIDYTYEGKHIGAVSSKKTNMRYEPDKKSPIEKKLVNGDSFVMYEETGEYMRVRTDDGLTGYVLTEDIAEIKYIQPVIREKVDTSLPSMPLDEKIVMVWDAIYNVKDNAKEDRRIRHEGLDVLSPTWFTFDGVNGDIINIADKSYVNWAHTNGYQVWALITDNFNYEVNHAVLTNSETREHVIKQLLAFVAMYDLDGINVDFEALRKDNAEYYLQFFRELYPLMKEQGAVLSVDMFVPRPYSMYYNRTEIGKTVDYVCVMTYDEHTAVSEKAGPVASLWFVEDGIAQTLNEVPKEKLIMGLPYYVRVWEEVVKQGKTTFSIRGNYSMNAAYNLFINNGAQFVWDDEIGSYYGEYKAKKDGEDVTYKVWLEDERSIEEKLNLLKKYNIAGAAGWRRGLETEGVWSLLNEYLK